MLINRTYVSTRQFHYDSATRHFSADISDLGKDFRFSQVYDDSIDEGLTLVSHKTGREIVFHIENIDVDSEGDVRAWQLVPAAYQQDVPPGLEVAIFND